ncbi:MAG: hypothetical protein VXV96_17875 [Bdellovibrionota bacterium]|nr:hypothetical protein [Bdellovibrionota bacterium]
MLKIIALIGILSLSAQAETRTEFIESTSHQISVEQRIRGAILTVHNSIKHFGVEGFNYGYACQDIGKAQLAIDIAIQTKMNMDIDLDKLSDDIDSIQDKICVRK